MSDSNIPFQITATKQEGKAVIRIVGEIGWTTNAEEFRSQVDRLIAEGVEDVHVYINSPGGSCFDAAEIVNILSKFEGKVTGEGGALVASAATYIAVHCSDFTMPENGMFMVHKPSGGVYGTADEIESYLSLLKAIDGEYYSSYSKIAKDKATLDKHWGVSDYWMTAKKAKEQGFVSKVTPKITLGKDADAIRAMMEGKGKELNNTNNINKNIKQMDVKVIAVTLGLSADATEEQVGAKIAENARKAAELDALKAQLEAERKSEKEASVKALLEKAIADKRITADTSAAWQKMLEDNFEAAKAAIEAIKPIEKLSSQVAISKDGGKATYNGKTFAELQDTDPEMLEELERKDPEAFAELFNAQYKKGGK
nr:MAG TPA: putative ATP dependent Clp protease [Caudoviricetes sp.]DAQ26743.1 MAG TPA: Putative ATP dependent Clp protease [Caudoviricetes sp.]